MKTGTVIELKPDDLKFNPQNRGVDVRHVARIKNAIAKRNLLHINPIKINQKKEIIDGQHRVHAALELSLKSVPCLVVNACVDDAVLLNQHAKNWSGLNFAQYWAAQGKTDYKKFIAFVEETHIKGSTALRLLAKGESFHFGNFKAGTFRVGDLSRAYAFVALLEDFRDLLPTIHTSPGYLNRQFIFALWHVVQTTPSYGHARLMRGIARHGLSHTSDTKVYLKQLMRAYLSDK